MGRIIARQGCLILYKPCQFPCYFVQTHGTIILATNISCVVLLPWASDPWPKSHLFYLDYFFPEIISSDLYTRIGT